MAYQLGTRKIYGAVRVPGKWKYTYKDIYICLLNLLLNSTIEIEQRYVKTALQVNQKFLTVLHPYRQVDIL